MNDAYNLPEDEVVERLRKLGVAIKYKPVAIVETNYLNGRRPGMRPSGYEEKDIYETLNSIMIRQKTNVFLGKTDFIDNL